MSTESMSSIELYGIVLLCIIIHRIQCSWVHFSKERIHIFNESGIFGAHIEHSL